MHGYYLSSVQTPISHGITEPTAHNVVAARTSTSTSTMMRGTAAAAAANVLGRTGTDMAAAAATETAGAGVCVYRHLLFVVGSSSSSSSSSDSSIGRPGSSRLPSVQPWRYMLIPKQDSAAGAGMNRTYLCLDSRHFRSRSRTMGIDIAIVSRDGSIGIGIDIGSDSHNG
jgi:hypothetical protein